MWVAATTMFQRILTYVYTRVKLHFDWVTTVSSFEWFQGHHGLIGWEINGSKEMWQETLRGN